jgi:hypothetical protein
MQDVMSGNDGRLGQWLERAGELLRSSRLESLAGEAELETLSLQLRTAWLRYACHVSSRYLKSPPHFQILEMPSGGRTQSPYDRWNKPEMLEARAADFRAPPAGWHAGHVMFNSGMGGIACLLQVLRHMYSPGAGSTLRLHGIGGYFEIMDIYRDTDDELFRLRIFADQAEFRQSVAREESHLVYIEPVYTRRGDLHVFDQTEFLQAWQQRPGRVPSIIVLDTTFTGNRFPLSEFLAQLAPQPPRAVLQLSSTLKLDQEGLEFSNGGLLSIYSTTEEIAGGIGRRMRKYRAAMGLGLTLDQTAALDYPGFLDPDSSNRHAQAVFANNARLARQLVVGPERLFVGKSHPALQGHAGNAWAVAPFVNVHIAPDTDVVDRELLKQVIHLEAGQRGLSFQPGSSFGFRGHRVETSIQAEEGIQVIRVAMGCRRGPSLTGTIDLLNELGQAGSFVNLRARYPQLVGKARRAAAYQY